MRKILTIIQGDFLLYWKEYTLLFFVNMLILAIPVLGFDIIPAVQEALSQDSIALMLQQADPATQTPPPPSVEALFHPRLALVNQSGIPRDALPEALSALVHYPDEDRAFQDTLEKTIEGYCVIPADFLDTRKVRCVYLSIYTAMRTTGFNSAFQDVYTAHAPQEQPTLHLPETIHIEHTTLNLVPIAENQSLMNTLLSSEENNDIVKQVSSFSLGVGLLILPIFQILNMVFTMGYSLIDEKRNRTMELLLSSLDGHHLLFGKLITQTLVELGTFLAGGMLLLHDLQIIRREEFISPEVAALFTPQAMLWVGAFLLCGYVLSGLLVLLLTVYAGHPNELRPLEGALYMVAIILIMIVAGGSFTAHTPLWLRLLSLLPPASSVMMPARLLTKPLATWELWLSLILLCATIFWMGRFVRSAMHSDVMLSGTTLKKSLRRLW
ncbi:MAG: hypothetical protein D6755_03910, partial [Anaerolineae bacterium]